MVLTAERYILVGTIFAIVICIAEISSVDAFAIVRTTFFTRRTAAHLRYTQKHRWIVVENGEKWFMS
jgi:hypothetical protein